MRIVLDTNVVISGMLWAGPPRRLLDVAVEGGIRLATSAALIDELSHTLAYPRLARQLAGLGIPRGAIVARYALLTDTVVPASLAAVVLRDPDDDAVLACALAAQADLIVSGDADLLDLKSWQGMPIVRAAEALRRIAAR